MTFLWIGLGVVLGVVGCMFCIALWIFKNVHLP